MMKVAVFLFVMVTALSGHTQSTASMTKNILILIGYADDHTIDGKPLLFSHIHHTQIAVETERVLKRFLAGFQFQQNEAVFSSGATRITLLNANVVCPGESLNQKQHRRVLICDSQRERSEMIMRYLESNLNQFDEFYYIGHARKGRGLGVGPLRTPTPLRLNFITKLSLDA